MTGKKGLTLRDKLATEALERYGSANTYRLLFELTREESLSHREIAEKFSTTESAVLHQLERHGLTKKLAGEKSKRDEAEKIANGLGFKNLGRYFLSRGLTHSFQEMANELNLSWTYVRTLYEKWSKEKERKKK